jgi:hypothetical protein
VPKNLDVERRRRLRPAEDRTFVLSDQTFMVKASIHPNVLAQLDSLDLDQPQGALGAIDGVIKSCLVKGDRAKWDAVRAIGATDADDDDPNTVTLADMNSVVEFIVELITGRPFGSSSGSSPGLGTTGTTSTGDSSSLAAPTPINSISVAS